MFLLGQGRRTCSAAKPQAEAKSKPFPLAYTGHQGGIALRNHYPFENKPLPYWYDGLEPYIDETTMQLHHDRHLKTYLDSLNSILKKYPQLQALTLEQLIHIAGQMPGKDCAAIARNAGGVYNHRFFFHSMCPDGKEAPEGALAAAIDRSFGSLDAFREKFTAAALSVFGSGYAWLVNGKRGLCLMTTANQETPAGAGKPLLNLDMWEHAYYLKHYNKRVDYISDWWNVVNWALAEQRYGCGAPPLGRE